MNNEYSKEMKRLMKIPFHPILIVILPILACVSLILAILAYTSMQLEVNKEKNNIETFNSNANLISTPLSDDTYIYSSLSPVLLTKPYSKSIDGTVEYCIAFDVTDNAYVVAINTNEMDKYKDLIAYTYGDTKEVPSLITLKGIPHKISNNLGTTSVKAINALTKQNIADTSDFQKVFGALLLDTTKEPTVDYPVIIIFILLITFCLLYQFYIINPLKIVNRNQKKLLSNMSSSELQLIDKELSSKNTVHFLARKLYITSDYIISKYRGLTIIPLDKIVHIYGELTSSRYRRNQAIIVVTNDEVKHKITVIPSISKTNKDRIEIIKKIKQLLPDITYGFEYSFYTNSSETSCSNITNDVLHKKSLGYTVLGIIGAILGSILGSILWIAIRKAGFIAGIAGFVMILFSIKGYGLLARGIDKKGRIISIVIGFLMIFVASYTSWVLEICRSYNMTGLIAAYKSLPRVLTLTNHWGSFIKDIVLGYLLSIWVCFILIRRSHNRV